MYVYVYVCMNVCICIYMYMYMYIRCIVAAGVAPASAERALLYDQFS